MRYSWNIPKWVAMYLPYILRAPNRIGLAISLLSGIQFFYTQFNVFRAFVYLRIKYNSQQIVLAYLLNKVFESTSIRVNTLSDASAVVYAFGDTIPLGYELQYSKISAPVYAADGAPRLQGEIIAPASLISKEGELKAWVDYVVFADKNYTIKFI